MADIAPADLVVDMTEQLVVDYPASETAPVAANGDVVVIAADDDEDDPLPANAELQPDGSVILKMHYPVVLKWTRPGSQDVREDRREMLHMRRLTGADMRAVMAAGQGHAVTTGIAKSCRIPQGIFNQLYDRMDGADAAAAAQVFSFFLDGGAPKATGQPSSP